MARTVVSLTSTFEQIAAGKCTISLRSGINKRIFVNETTDQNSALNRITCIPMQIRQCEDKPTYAKLGPGLEDGDVKLIVDTEG